MTEEQKLIVKVYRHAFSSGYTSIVKILLSYIMTHKLDTNKDPDISDTAEMVWAQVGIVSESYEGEDDWVTIRQIHTVRVDRNCDCLRKECELALSRAGIKFISIENYKFIKGVSYA